MSQLPQKRISTRWYTTVLLLLGSGALVALGCGGPAEVPKREPPTVRVSRPLAQTVMMYLEETGTTEAVERVDVRARVTGFLEQVNFEAGADVEAGAELYVIEPRPFVALRMAAEADRDAMKVALTKAQIEYDRQLRLQQRNATSDTEIVAAEAERDGADAAVKAAEAALDQAKLEEEYTSVTAPIGGRVGKTLVKLGNLVEKAAATQLTTIVNYDNIYANFNISERDLLQIMNRREEGRKVDPKSVRVLLSRATDAGFPFQGHLDYADLAVDESTGTYAVRAIFPNPSEQIVPGLFVRIRVVGAPKEVLMVPETSIRADQAGRYLLVVSSENVVERRDVELDIQRRGYQLTPELRQWCVADLKLSAEAPVEEIRDAVAQAIAAGKLTRERLDELSRVQVVRDVLRGLKADDSVIVGGIQRARDGIEVTKEDDPLDPLLFDVEVAAAPGLEEDAESGSEAVPDSAAAETAAPQGTEVESPQPAAP